MIGSRYLDSEERFEILTVKAAERPHLLHWTQGDILRSRRSIHDQECNENAGDEKKTDDILVNHLDDEEHQLPLTDGCDLPGWRSERISPSMSRADSNTCSCIELEDPFHGALSVGTGSILFRRERQFPFICSNFVSCRRKIDRAIKPHCWWFSAKEQLTIPPPFERTAPVVPHENVSVIVDYSPFNDDRKRKVTVFSLEYEMKNIPVKIVNAAETWRALPRYANCDDSRKSHTNIQNYGPESWMDVEKHSVLFSGGGKGGWTFANLVTRFGNVGFRFSDLHGEMMSLNTYAKYVISPEGISDDSPLGIYDSEFGDDELTSELLSEYSVPSCFSPDLFDLIVDDSVVIDSERDSETDDLHSKHSKLSQQRDRSKYITQMRPPYRWILIGPERSGTGMHVDPLWTNAWVTILQGLKRWLLFPPDTPYESIGMIPGKPQIPSSVWFRDYHTKVTSSSWPKQYQPVEVLQYPGETVFVPAGWPHIVLNLELTVAVTHNYASEFGPINKIWDELVQNEPDFALTWYCNLKKCGREDLARSAPDWLIQKCMLLSE